MKASRLLLLVLATCLTTLVIFITGFMFGREAYSPGQTKPSGPDFGCTSEAKLCPDGSAVGRQAPDCEFDDCQVETPAAMPAP